MVFQANGTGTPDVATSGSVRTVGRRQRRKTGDGFINMLTPRRKRTTHGSYNLRQASSHLAATNMSLQVPASGNEFKKYAQFWVISKNAHLRKRLSLQFLSISTIQSTYGERIQEWEINLSSVVLSLFLVYYTETIIFSVNRK